MTGIQLDIRSKIYKPHATATHKIAIQNLKFRLLDGEFACVFGPSGCGKTTLLNIVAGLDHDFDGRITVDTDERPPVIGCVFQEPRLLPWRTVRQNVEIALQPGRAHESVDEMLSALGLEQVHQVYPERLSLGMSRRVAIARAFAIRPDLLLMDEPFASLDAPTARKVREQLANLWIARPHTVIFVTHDIREAITLADRIIFLSHSPATTVGEVRVDIARADRTREDLIEEFRRKLLDESHEIAKLL